MSPGVPQKAARSSPAEVTLIGDFKFSQETPSPEPALRKTQDGKAKSYSESRLEEPG